MLKVLIEGKQGEGKTILASIIFNAIIKNKALLNVTRVVNYNDEELSSKLDPKADVVIITKQTR